MDDPIARYIDTRTSTLTNENTRRLRAIRARRNYGVAKLLTHCLSIVSQVLLVLAVTAMIAALWGPSFLLPYTDYMLVVFTASVMVKLVLALATLETKAVQGVFLLSFVTIMVVAKVDTWYLPVGLGCWSAAFIAFLHLRRHQYKCDMALWMVIDEQQWTRYMKMVNQSVITEQEALGLHGFDDLTYRRDYTVAQGTVTAIATQVDGRPLTKGTVRVEVWRRLPAIDLSSLEEFQVCCFLGGSQDSSAFDFMMSRAITMLDFRSHAGRVNRVLLMACQRKGADGSCRPVLVVNAVFGRPKGLIGSAKVDDTFIYEQILAYGRYLGVSQVLFNTSPTNLRPSQFVTFLRKTVLASTRRHHCRLIGPPQQLKLEIFGRRARQYSIYLTLILEISSSTNEYCSQGSIEGISVPLEGGAHCCSQSEPISSGLGHAVGRLQWQSALPMRVDLPASMAGTEFEQCFNSIVRVYPALASYELPPKLTVVAASGIAAIIDLNVRTGTVFLSAAHLEDAPSLAWQRRVAALLVGWCVLERFHPYGTRDFSMRLLSQQTEHLIRAFERDAEELAPWFEQLASIHAYGRTLLHLLFAVLSSKRDLQKLFSMVELAEFCAATAWCGLDGSERAALFVKQQIERDEHVRQKQASARISNLLPVYRSALTYTLVHHIQAMSCVERIPLDFPYEQWEQVRADCRGVRSLYKRVRTALARSVDQHICRLEKRARICARLATIEGMVRRGNATVARQELQRMLTVAPQWIRPQLERLSSEVRWATWNNLIQRFNLAHYW